MLLEVGVALLLSCASAQPATKPAAAAPVAVPSPVATGNPEQARDDRRYKKLCARPRFLVALTDNDVGALSNAKRLMGEARLCDNTEKPQPPREPGCRVAEIVKGGTFEKLSLKDDDWVIGDSEGAVKSTDRLVHAVGEIAKDRKGCLVVTRKHWTFAIGYLVKKPRRSALQ